MFLWAIGIAISTSVIPLTIIILLHYNYVLIKRLSNAEHINEILKNKKYKYDKVIVLEDENKNKKFSVSLDSLLYITAADNYIDIYLFEDNKIRHELIRNSLTTIEKTFTSTKQLFRCHKSFIINLNNVVSVTGNTAGYKLKLKNTDTLIPVSRKHNNRVVEIFNS
jgi:DNA-binding LytR/AlgR family response regulator